MIDKLAARDRDGPGRDPPEELHPARRVPVHQQLRPGLRLGRLRGVARQGAGAGRLRRRSASEQAEAPQEGPLPRHRPLDLDRDLRLRPERGDGAARPAAWRWSNQPRCASTRPARSQVYVGTHAHGQGHETTFAQIAADTLGRAVRLDRDPPRRHRRGPGVRLRHVRQPQPGGRRHGGAHDVPRRSSTRRSKIAAHLLEASPRTTSSSTRAASTSRAIPATRKTMGEVAFASFGASLPEGMEHGLEAVVVLRPAQLRVAVRRPHLRRRGRSRRPAASTCRSTSPSTTAATSSTR